MVQVQKKTSPPPLPLQSPLQLLAHAINVAVVFGILRAASGFEDAPSAMAFYGVYHREPMNQLIHFFGVPLILWSMIAFQAHLPITSSFILRLPGLPAHHPTWATFILPFYTLAYLKIDVFGACLYAPIWYIMYATSVRWRAKDQKDYLNENVGKVAPWTGTGRVLKVAAAVHVFAWYIQIHPGHKVIEGAQPAVMQSLGGALFTAPLFAFYEGIWFVGLRQDFQQQVLALVDQLTKDLCANGAAMQACETI